MRRLQVPRVLALLVLPLAVLWHARPAQACSPAWPRNLIPHSVALLHGTAIKVSADRYAAKMEVTAYAGPGRAPRLVRLPKRELPEGLVACHDLREKFEPGAEYLVLLTAIPSDPVVLSPDVRIVYQLDQGGIQLQPPEDKEPVQDVLATFAQERGLEVQRPDASSPAWAASEFRGWFGVVAAALVCFGAILALLAFRRG